MTCNHDCNQGRDCNCARHDEIVFSIDALPGETLRLDSKGFHYKGQVIEDAGEAYTRFMRWLELAEGAK